MDRKALFIGRWQPFHLGHAWLISQKLDRGIPVLIAVRDVQDDSSNFLTTAQTVEMLQVLYHGQDVEVIVIPDIESVNYGRGVGYEINEFTPPEEIESISGTNIRLHIRKGSQDWKGIVDPKVQDFIEKFYSDCT